MSTITDGSNRIEICEPMRRVIVVNIRGLTPLIVHRFSEKARKQMLESMQKNKNKTGEKKQRDDKDPEAEFRASRYILQDGSDGFNAVGFKTAISEAAKGLVRINGKKIHATDIRKMLYVRPTGYTSTGDQCVHITGECVMRSDIVNLSKTGKHTPDLRYRGEFPEWSASLEIEYDDNMVSLESLLGLIQRAGKYVGVGEWRPQRGGIYGCFTVESVQEVAE